MRTFYKAALAGAGVAAAGAAGMVGLLILDRRSPGYPASPDIDNQLRGLGIEPSPNDSIYDKKRVAHFLTNVLGRQPSYQV